MKKLFFLLIFAATTVCCFSQATGNTKPGAERTYLQKSKTKKTTAWVLLGGGAVLDIVGLAVYPTHYNGWGSKSERNRNTPSIVLLAADSSMMIISIPFFAAGHRYKEKAASLTIDTQQSPRSKSNNIYSVNYPALKMTITL